MLIELLLFGIGGVNRMTTGWYWGAVLLLYALSLLTALISWVIFRRAERAERNLENYLLGYRVDQQYHRSQLWFIVSIATLAIGWVILPLIGCMFVMRWLRQRLVTIYFPYAVENKELTPW